MTDLTGEANARLNNLAQQLKDQQRKAKRTAVQLGVFTEVLYWASVAFGGIGTALGLLGSKRLGVPDGTIEPWISLCAAASTGGFLVLKQAGLRAKTAIWFDFTSYIDTLLFRLQFRLPFPPTLDAVASVAEAFEKARMDVQKRMSDVDGAAESKKPVPSDHSSNLHR